MKWARQRQARVHVHTQQSSVIISLCWYVGVHCDKKRKTRVRVRRIGHSDAPGGAVHAGGLWQVQGCARTRHTERPGPEQTGSAGWPDIGGMFRPRLSSFVWFDSSSWRKNWLSLITHTLLGAGAGPGPAYSYVCVFRCCPLISGPGTRRTAHNSSCCLGWLSYSSDCGVDGVGGL